MYSRWSNVAVVVLWLSAMGWLVKSKVLPPLLTGQPPNNRTILEAQRKDRTVGWTMDYKGQPLGWALSTTVALPDDLTEIRSWVHFRDLPLTELPSVWLRTLLPAVQRPGPLETDAKNTTLIDPLGRLSSFRSEVRFESLDEPLKMDGTIVGTLLKLQIHWGEFSHDTEVPIPQEALLSDALSPRTQLPGLQIGQTWTVPVYSPLRPSEDPVEILQATVEGTEPIVWNGQPIEALVVVHRRDPGHGLGSDKKIRGKLWVRQDGTVLRQQLMIFSSPMTFVRLPDDEAATLERRVNKDSK